SRFRPSVPRKRVELACVKVLAIEGSWASLSPTEISPVWKNSSPPTEVTGRGDSRFGRRIREPVTVIASFPAAVQAGGSGVPAGTWHDGAATPDLISCSLCSACGGDWSDLV